LGKFKVQKKIEILSIHISSVGKLQILALATFLSHKTAEAIIMFQKLIVLIASHI